MTATAEDFIRLKQQVFQAEKGKEIRVKDISRQGWHIWKCEARTFMQQSDHPEKVFMIERLLYSRSEGKILASSKGSDSRQYRIGYFVVAKVGKRKGNWWWGQYCPIIPSRDFRQLISKAEKEGTILDESVG